MRSYRETEGSLNETRRLPVYIIKAFLVSDKHTMKTKVVEDGSASETG
jgi:hypothetical protein